jgi:hypothetical protein
VIVAATRRMGEWAAEIRLRFVGTLAGIAVLAAGCVASVLDGLTGIVIRLR